MGLFNHTMGTSKTWLVTLFFLYSLPVIYAGLPTKFRCVKDTGTRGKLREKTRFTAVRLNVELDLECLGKKPGICRHWGQQNLCVKAILRSGRKVMAKRRKNLLKIRKNPKKKRPNPPDHVIGLSCGENHAKKLGFTGYDRSSHWCSNNDLLMTFFFTHSDRDKKKKVSYEYSDYYFDYNVLDE